MVSKTFIFIERWVFIGYLAILESRWILLMDTTLKYLTEANKLATELFSVNLYNKIKLSTFLKEMDLLLPNMLRLFNSVLL